LNFVYDAVRGEASLQNISGPVGIGKMAKDAGESGFKNFVLFIAILSLHLAVLNAFPFPALDGGRFLMILWEAVRKKPINKSVAQKINLVGFLLLIILMIVVTYNDIVKLL
jgi:regulator of sigma E protease